MVTLKNNQLYNRINNIIIAWVKYLEDIRGYGFNTLNAYKRDILDFLRFCKNKDHNFLSPNTLLTDVGSTKKNLQEIKNKKLNKKLNWIMSHPISGSEVSGPEHGSRNLFKKKWCIIIRDKNKKALLKVSQFWKRIGAKIVFMQIEEHDKIFSMTSHLPHLIAYNLIKTAQDFQKKNKKNIIKFSAGGLRDFSRTAASNEIMWRDIFVNNSEAVLEMLQRFNEDLSDLQKAIRKKDGKKLHSFFSRTKSIREKIIEAGLDKN